MALGTVLKKRPSITVVNVDSTQDSHTLRSQTRAFQVRCNEANTIRVAFTDGDTDDGDPYFVIDPGQVWWEDDVSNGDTSWVIYLRAPDVTSGTTPVAILEWQ